jgi:hypothetical protein
MKNKGIHNSKLVGANLELPSRRLRKSLYLEL